MLIFTKFQILKIKNQLLDLLWHVYEVIQPGTHSTHYICIYHLFYIITKITNYLANVWTDLGQIWQFSLYVWVFFSLWICIFIWHHSLVLVKQKYVMNFKWHEIKNASPEIVYNIVTRAWIICALSFQDAVVHCKIKQSEAYPF